MLFFLAYPHPITTGPKMSNTPDIYRDLQIHLDKLPIGYPATKSGIELKILEYFFSPIEAELALCLTLNKTPLKAIHKRINQRYSRDLELSEVEKMADKLYLNGSIDRTIKDGKRSYSNNMLVIGMFEFQVDRMSREFMEMLHQYLDEGFGEEFFRTTIPQLRTSPHLEAVIPEHIIDTYDNMKAFVTNTDRSIQVANCVCKQGSDLIEKPCKQVDNYEICLMFDAESYLDRGQARTITKEECLEILDYAEEKGLVLQPGNTYEPFCICLCCGCCCGVITTAKKFPKPAQLFATNYYAELDSERCINCGICVNRCQIDAIVEDRGDLTIDLDRCIGCGLCVTKCPKDAIKLHKKSRTKVPPKNIVNLYLSILKKKVGKKKLMLNMLKMIMGRQI